MSPSPFGLSLSKPLHRTTRPFLRRAQDEREYQLRANGIMR